jgi:hypothetical protein
MVLVTFRISSLSSVTNFESMYVIDTLTRLLYPMQAHIAQFSIEEMAENAFTIVQDVPNHEFINSTDIRPCAQSPLIQNYYLLCPPTSGSS